MFDLRFLCRSNKEAKQYVNFLDLRKTLLGISMSLDGDDSEELDAMDNWIQEMTLNIKKEARKRGMKTGNK